MKISYNSETDKIRETVKDHIGKVCVDVGCYDSKICDRSLGINTHLGPLVSLVVSDYISVSKEVPELINYCDTVFSSHILYVIDNWISALDSWKSLLKVGGNLIVYLPDERLWDYSNNPKSIHRFQYESFCSIVLSYFSDLSFVDGGFDIGHDKYSFFVIFKKKAVSSQRYFEHKVTHELSRISSGDYEVLRKIYDSLSDDIHKKAIQSAIDEIEYLSRKAKL